MLLHDSSHTHFWLEPDFARRVFAQSPAWT
jgi:hypothetical protein